MKRALKLALIVLFLSASVFAQSPPSAKRRPPRLVDETWLAAQSDVRITSDTQGVNFGPYLQRVVRDIKQNWSAIVPEVARPPLLTRGIVVLGFAITRNGQVESLHYERSSGNVALDRAAYNGITASNPFPPLPSEFSGPYLGLSMTFRYNSSRLTGISPSQVEVRVGSSELFVPIFQEKTDATRVPITWIVVGRSCAGSACGTVSTSGLYTAPATVPDPPTVWVEAKAGDLGETASAIVTIVPAERAQSNGQH